MDLVALVAACALAVDPKLMHASSGTNRVANRGRSRCRENVNRRSIAAHGRPFMKRRRRFPGASPSASD
jgi:hypothetical protein